MEKGAIGISTGLEYAPWCFTATNELIEIAKIVKKYNGIYTTHLRSETGKPKEKFRIIEAIKETIEICEKAEIPIEISHLKLRKPFGDVNIQQVFELIENARSRGLDVTADQYPYKAGSTMLSFLLLEKFKIKKRGKIKINYFADISIIDLNRIKDNATYLNPHQYSDGIEYLFINGNLTIGNNVN